MTERFDIDREALLRRFCALVAVDNESYCERQMADAVIGQLAELGVEVKEDGAAERIGGNAGNLYAYLPGRGTLADAEPIAFCAHLDSVTPAKGKRVVVDADGAVRSAGDTVLGADDLSAVAALLQMADTLQQTKVPCRPIELLFTVCEEPYTQGSRAWREDELPLRSTKIFVPDLTGKVGTAVIAAPTIVALHIVVTGRAAHAGFAPEAGIHAISVAANALSRLTLGHVDRETTVGIGTICGGTVPNAVPERCELRGELRGYDDARVWEELENIKTVFSEEAAVQGAAVRMDTEERTHAYTTDPTSPIVAMFRAACERSGLPCVLTRTFGGSDANTFAARGYHTLVIANAMKDIHSVQESTDLEEMTRLCRLLTELTIQ